METLLRKGCKQELKLDQTSMHLHGIDSKLRITRLTQSGKL